MDEFFNYNCSLCKFHTNNITLYKIHLTRICHKENEQEEQKLMNLPKISNLQQYNTIKRDILINLQKKETNWKGNPAKGKTKKMLDILDNMTIICPWCKMETNYFNSEHIRKHKIKDNKN